MRLAVLAAAVVVLGAAAAPAHAMSGTAESFAAAMQGCWNRTTWSAAIEAQRADPGYAISSQMCLSGGVEGVLSILDCSGVNNLVECTQTEGRYAFRDERFWRDFGEGALEGRQNNCDVTLEAGQQFTLRNCLWVDAPASATPIEDVVYERAIGQ